MSERVIVRSAIIVQFLSTHQFCILALYLRLNSMQQVIPNTIRQKPHISMKEMYCTKRQHRSIFKRPAVLHFSAISSIQKHETIVGKHEFPQNLPQRVSEVLPQRVRDVFHETPTSFNF